MSDPFSSPWIYVLLFSVSIAQGWRIARCCFVSAVVAYAAALLIRSAASDWSTTLSRFPSVSVALIGALSFWIILGKSLSVRRALSFLLVVGTVVTNRVSVGAHALYDVLGGIAVAALGIVVGRWFFLWMAPRPFTHAELPQQWPDRIYVPSGSWYAWSRAEVAERYPYPLTPLGADLFLPAVGRSVQKMARILGIKRPGVIGYSTRGGYAYSNMRPEILKIPSVLRRFIVIRKGFLRYASFEYPNARAAFWQEHHRLDRRLLSLRQNGIVSEAHLLLSDCLSLFEKWMLQQSISLFYVTFGFFYLQLMLRLHFPRRHGEVEGTLPLGLPTVSDGERLLLFRLGRMLGSRSVAWDDLDDEAKLVADQLLVSLGDQASSYDFTDRTWRETPDRILELARSTAEAPESPEKQMARLSAERKNGESRLTRRMRAVHPFSGKRLAEDMIQLTHRLYCLKEERQKQMAAAWALVKRAVLVLGEFLTAAGVVCSPEDVHFLTAKELAGLVHRQALGRSFLIALNSKEDVAAAVRARRNELEMYRSMDVPEPGPTAVLELPWKKPKLSASGLLAKYGSRGQAVGPAVVIRTQEEFHKMKPGRILVAPVTNPHWDILFAGALGVAVEKGGPTSHAMLKASEYGLPAVIGLPGITKRIKDGDVLRLDADKKLLTWEPESA
jgi:phosphohistidine swiveling domain-containing protein